MESKGFVEGFSPPPSPPTFLFLSFFTSIDPLLARLAIVFIFRLPFLVSIDGKKGGRGEKRKRKKNGQIIYVRPDRSSGIGFSSILDACAEIKRARSRSGKQLEIQAAQLRSIVRSRRPPQ